MADNIGSLKIVSFNCCGVTNKLPVIKDLCEDNDIVLLQETWLMSHNIGILDGVHQDCTAYSTSAVDCTQALVGRPHGGLSVLWKKHLSSYVNISLFDDTRILGIDLSISGKILHILNVYLPYYSIDNYDLYLEYVGKICSIIESREHSDLAVFGDFNADVDREYFREWDSACSGYDLVFADVHNLPLTTFTHINNATLSTSWLDHLLCSRTVFEALNNIYVDTDYHGSDHIPLCASLNFSELPSYVVEDPRPVTPEIDWDFEDHQKTTFFYELLVYHISCIEPIRCNSSGNECSNIDHVARIDAVYNDFLEVTLAAGEQAFGRRKHAHSRNIPGWNEHFRVFYDCSRADFLDFLAWREAGSPREGAVALHMRRTRAHFKLAMRRCK